MKTPGIMHKNTRMEAMIDYESAGTLKFENTTRFRRFDGHYLHLTAIGPKHERLDYFVHDLVRTLKTVPFGIADHQTPLTEYRHKMENEGPWVFVQGRLGTIELGYMWLDPWLGRTAQLHIVRKRKRVPKKAYIDIARFFMMECFQILGIHRLSTSTIELDEHTRRDVFLLGFRPEGRIMEALWFDGHPHNLIVHGLLGRDFKWHQ